MFLKILPFFIRFAGVGAIGTAIHFSVLFFLVHYFGFTPVLGAAIGAICGAAVNYLLSYFYVFSSRISHRIALPRFSLIFLQGFLLNVAIMYLLVHQFDANYMFSQVIATACILVVNFLGSYLWAFGPHRNRDRSKP